MLRERPGNVVVLSGRNRGKIDRIVASVRGGLNVLADKPWILKSEDLPKVEAALAEADAKGVVAYDIMTERFELTSILQRALVNDPATFGEIVPRAREADPAVYMESVHHLMKTVAGAPNIRPAWFFDTAEQGEGLNDIGTHLVDLVQWTLFPDQAIDYKSDVRVLAAQRWPTVIPEDRVSPRHRRAAVSREPVGIDQGRQTRVLRQHAGVVHAARRPHQAERHLGLGSAGRIWRHAFRVLQGHACAHRGPPDAGRSLSAGALCRSRGGRGQGRRCSPPCRRRSRRCSARIPGIGVEDRGAEIHVTIPETLREGHEAHFAQVTAGFLKYLRQRGTLPAWERPNMAGEVLRDHDGNGVEPEEPGAAGAAHRAAVGIGDRGCEGCSGTQSLGLGPRAYCSAVRAEHLLELVRRRDLELRVVAVDRALVGAPALENGGVTEAVALHVVVFHFADPLDPQRLPRQILAGAPAALAARHARRVPPASAHSRHG